MGDGRVAEASEASSRERPFSALGRVGAHESSLQRFGTYSFRYIPWVTGGLSDYEVF